MVSTGSQLWIIHSHSWMQIIKASSSLKISEKLSKVTVWVQRTVILKDVVIGWGIKLSGCYWPEHELQNSACCSCRAAGQWGIVLTRKVSIPLSVPGKSLMIVTESQWRISSWVLAKGLLIKQMSHRMLLLFITERSRGSSNN